LHNEAHTKLVREALQELAIQGYTAWENQTGVWFEENGRPHKYGKKGSADIIAIYPIEYHGIKFGIHCEFEAKTGNAVQKKNQKLHQKFVVERNGGIYIVFRAADVSDEAIKTGVDELLSKIKTAVQKYRTEKPHTQLQ